MSLQLPKQQERPNSGITALIDGDIISYSIGFACQKNTYQLTINGEQCPRATFNYKKELKQWVEDNGLDDSDYTVATDILGEPVENALHSVKVFINDVLEATNAEHYKVFLTGSNNFRDSVATILPYKGNRDNLHKPIHYQAIRDYLVERWDAVVVEGMEADDALAIEQMFQMPYTPLSSPKNRTNGKTVICSIDKDLRMVPGWHYNWNKDEKPVWVSEEEGIRWLYTQAITGDKADNIPGLSEKAPKKRTFSEKPLANLKTGCDMYEYVLEGYVEKYGEEKAKDSLHENLYLLWMVRELDSEGKPVMWKPPV